MYAMCVLARCVNDSRGITPDEAAVGELVWDVHNDRNAKSGECDHCVEGIFERSEVPVSHVVEIVSA